MAGCPKCSVDLLRANPHKPTVDYPNGFSTFASLAPGEVLNLPEKWFNGDLDSRPTAYFAALPYADGVTPSTLGAAAAGVLADYAALDVASAKVGELAALGDKEFNAAVNDTAASVDAAVQDVGGTGSPAIYAAPYAQDTRKATGRARQSNGDLTAAISAGSDSSFNIRNDILHDFANALASARLALQAFYGDAPTAPTSAPIPVSSAPSSGGFSVPLIAAAHAAADAMAADPSYCVSVSKSGSPVNSAVHAFKTAWNSSQTTQVPIGTGNYEKQTADVLAQVLGGSPSACAPHASSSAPAAAQPLPVAAAPSGISTGAVVGIGLLGAGVIGGAVYLTTKNPKRGRRQKRRA